MGLEVYDCKQELNYTGWTEFEKWECIIRWFLCWQRGSDLQHKTPDSLEFCYTVLNSVEELDKNESLSLKQMSAKFAMPLWLAKMALQVMP